MSKKGLRLLGLALAVLTLGGLTSSCKSQHELCPAYTKAPVSDSNQGV
ncbi:MAG: hypothetical protein ACJA0Q_001573 [Saprospiraceae bacterium]|jgi:hypothetical protein